MKRLLGGDLGRQHGCQWIDNSFYDDGTGNFERLGKLLIGEFIGQFPDRAIVEVSHAAIGVDDDGLAVIHAIQHGSGRFPSRQGPQLHADIGWFIGALTVALVIGLRYAGGSRRTVRLGWIVLVGLGVQGVIGYVQYFNHLPAGLVWVHVASSVTVWIFVLQLFLSTGTNLPRSAAPADDPVAASPPIKTTIL